MGCASDDDIKPTDDVGQTDDTTDDTSIDFLGELDWLLTYGGSGAVLEFYNSGMQDSPTLDAIFRLSDGSFGIPLTSEDQAKIITFLKTLTDENFLFDTRFSEF